MQNQETNKRRFGKKKFAILGALAMMMVLTIGLTWAFWSAGVAVDDANRNVNIGVGQAAVVNTLVNLSDTDLAVQGRLIPQGLNHVTDGNTQVITFSITASWITQVTSDQDAITGLEGTLAVNLASIRFAEDDGTTLGDFIYNTDVDNVVAMPIGFRNRNASIVGDGRYYEDAPLFEVTAVPVTTTIIGNDTTGVVVNFTVRMNFPRNEAMYELIANSNIVLGFNFSVAPPDGFVVDPTP